jgi:hypothetical protein
VNQGPGQAQTQIQAQAQGGSLSYPYQYPYPYSLSPTTGRRYWYDRYGRVIYEYEEQGGYEWSHEYLCYRFPYLCQPILPYAYAQPDTIPVHPRIARPVSVPQTVQRQVVQQVPVTRKFNSILKT